MAIRMSTLFLRTLREDPADAEVPSHKLLVRAGYVRRVAPGIYSWLPLGVRMLERVSRVCVYARVSADPRQMMPRLRDEVRRIDPNLVVADMRTLDEQIDTRMSNERMLSFLSIGFAVLATILAVVGVHGVLLFQIARRTREIGVRMALGADSGSIRRMVLGEGAAVIAAGVGVGLAAALVATRFLQTLLFEIRPGDPLTLLFVSTLLSIVGLAACYLPARRATRIDPLAALRTD